MAVLRAHQVVALIIVVFLHISSAFNLEPRIPIIKKGAPKTHFGYTVAQHKTLDNSRTSSNLPEYTSWMLVGAPKGENLQPGTKKSGALYKCPLTNKDDDCVQVLTDGFKNSNGIYKIRKNGDLMKPSEDEVKDGQWMGVTVKSQGEGGDILVCAHRYMQRGLGAHTYQWGYGLCYRLNDGFEFEQVFQPCLGKPVKTGQEQWGYCQAGTSGAILDDEVVLGLPGVYNWRGTIHVRNTTNDFLFRDKTDYFGVYTEDKSPVDKYAYLGYSVAAGKFFGDKISYVAGAPRSQGTGQVILFSRERVGKSDMDYDLIINGEMFASSFGFEVLAMDTNNDGHDDLIVSAPFYFTKHTSGAVYIYLNNGKGIDNTTPFTRLEGPAGESRFGFSMTSLGDLNADGYNDLAVGAPYDGKGAIYIYLGSENGIPKEHSQLIRAEDLPGVAYEAFGYALSGGLDLDGNNYTDLLTSSFCSDRVILLRARPIVSITSRVDVSNMNNINPNSNGCPEDFQATVPCFSFKTCFTMTNDAGVLSSLEVRYNISERVYKDSPIHRIRFHRSKPDKPSTVQQLINLRPHNIGQEQCFDELVYIRKDIRDVLRPIRFKLAYEINQQEPKPAGPEFSLPDINEYPILDQKEAVKNFEATFARECGDDDICKTDLVVKASLDLQQHEDGHHVLELGERQFFNLTTSVTNIGEPAYVPTLFVKHDKAIDLSLRESATGSYQCAPMVGNGLVKCELDNPLLNTTGNMHLVFKPSGLPFRTRFIDLLVWANTSSSEINTDNDRVQFLLEVKRRAEISILGAAEPEQVFYSGDIIGESEMKKKSDVGTEVIHKYLIDNRGPWKVDELKVIIDWPYQVENNRKKGKWLLYLTDIPTVDAGNGECDVNPRYVNPLKLDSEYIEPDSEVDLLRSFTTQPSVYSTTTKIKKTKKVTSSTTKKVHKKISSSKSSSSSSSHSSSSSTDEDQHYSSSGRAGGTRTHNRVSRKVYSSADRNRVKPDQYEDNTDDYENYDNFFYGNKEDKSDGRETGVEKESARLKSVENIRTMTEGGRSFLNGYDADGRLIWSSSGPTSNDKVRHEQSRRVYTSSSGDKINFQDNNLLLDDLMTDIVDFRIVSDDHESWVNGYDSTGTIVWSSKFSFGGAIGGSGSSSSRKEYSYKETTENGKGKAVWSSSVTDEDGTRSHSGSSVISGQEDRDVNRRRFESNLGGGAGDGHRRTSSSRTFESSHGGGGGDGNHKSQNSRTFQSTRTEYSSNSRRENDSDWSGRTNHDGGRWSQSGGFRRKEYVGSQGGEPNYYNQESNRSFQRQPERHSSDLHGNTYARAVVDPDSGSVDVLSQKVFSRKSGNQWEEVRHGPYDEREWTHERNPDQALRRQKREREFIIKPQAITDTNTGKTMQIISFTCDGDVPTAKCFQFECTIRNLAAEQSASIKIRSRLWNSTLVEDYPRVSYVSIKSRGEIFLPEEIRYDQDPSDDVSYAETLAYTNLLEQLPPEQVPVWVIIVSVLAGLLLLVLIAILLYKIGFFKRKRPDPTLSGNLDRDINGYN